ncbi:cysteine hydrolase [Rhodocytophaga rosea]|uniref:Cysteine hydrolase n=1 Tax=Rhodocytophaga rosea TaxID=2704465 RepID=A0A6C0GPH9_9BACT|nr:cysteine hydrolase family protein [Rhodocytophaga rosea]QHT69956.1 cysteine hydrolase [Rhodocytophaga rosea]
MESPAKALLIIDMQKGAFTSHTPRFESESVIERINELIDIFRKAAHPIIFIQHDGTAENYFIPGTTEWELLSELHVSERDLIISKTANDAFYQTALESYLRKNRINELFITGSATDFCVESTVQSALTKDFQVTIVKDAHTTADRPHMKADQIIEHYNWIWQNLAPTRGIVKVIDMETALP